jgi:hypothetical protein
MVSRLRLLFVGCLAGCATTQDDESQNKLPYGCSDLVVVGRVVTLAGETLPEPAPLPNWQSRWRLQVKIRQVLRGAERRTVVPATSVSHAQIRDDKDFLVVLTPNENGSYAIGTAALWDRKPRPRPAEPCS